MSLLHNLSTEDVEKAFNRSQEEISSKLKLPDLEFTTDPISLKVSKDYESKQQITQYLQDLGYLREGNITAVSEILQLNAIRRWKRDSKALNSDTLNYDRQHSLFSFHSLDSNGFDLLYLVAQMGFEAEIEIKRLPSIGDVSLLSRIIHYRLRVFGVFNSSVDTPFSELSLKSIEAVARTLKQGDSLLQTVNLLGNTRELSRKFMQHQGTWVFVFKQRPTIPEVLKESYINNIHQIDKDILELENKKHPWVYEHTFVSTGVHYQDSSGRRTWGERDGLRYYRKSEVWGKIRLLAKKRLPAHQANENLVNKFGFELLQLRLWLLGFYKGEVDGDWGTLTMLAVKEFLYSSGIKNIGKLIKPVQGGYAVVNMRYLFKKLLAETENQADSVSEKDAKELSLKIFSEAVKNDQWQQFEVAHEKIEEQYSGIQSTNRRRRRSYSFRGLLSAVGRFFGNIANSLIKVVKEVWSALKKLATYAVTIFRKGIEFIRRGMQLVGLAIKRTYYWMLEKPILSASGNSLAITRFSHDGDAFHFVSNANKSLLERHHKTIKRMNLAFSIMARVGFKALGLMKDFATYNWLRMAWKLYSILSGSFWQELKLTYSQYQLAAE